MQIMPLHVLHDFWSDDTGAVTVDWVVLTAALVGLALAVTAVLFAGVADLNNGVASSIKQVGTSYTVSEDGTFTLSTE
jgi:hypothetical protein